MNQNEVLERWLAEKRKIAPPSTFSQMVMASVEQTVEPRCQLSKELSYRSLATSHNVPYWGSTAAVIVCAMRTAFFIQMLVLPTRDFLVVSPIAIPEVPNVE